MKTGKLVQNNWLYSSDCCLLEVFFKSGDSFSRCPKCSSLCDWEMVDITSKEMKALVVTSQYSKTWSKWSNSKTLEPRHFC
jgi:hypothetical protein